MTKTAQNWDFRRIFFQVDYFWQGKEKMHRLNMLRFKRSWEDGSYQEGHGSDAETQSVWTKFSWFSSLLKEGFGYVMFSCSSIDLPRLAPSVIFVPPGAFQNLHLNVIAGSVLLFSSLGALEVKLQLSSNCPFMYPLEKGWDCFLLNSWQNFCWYTGEQYLVLVLHVTTNSTNMY